MAINQPAQAGDGTSTSGGVTTSFATAEEYQIAGADALGSKDLDRKYRS